MHTPLRATAGRTGKGTVSRPRVSAAVKDELKGDSKAPPFLVAAVGASAGGLEALSGLLRAIPGNASLALVLVQHLARDQKSILPELLAHATELTVVLAKDEQKIEPRHVYVIPPDARMTVSDGHLRVRPSPQQRLAEGTVDALFRSVASEYKDRAIGVVLSGSAHDGAAGIREIKAAGGLTMAQSPEQATIDGMPRAAIATGTVDAVLSVEEIGDQLVRLSKHPFFARERESDPEAHVDVPQLLQIFSLLRRATGIDFSRYKLPTLQRRMERRIALHRLHGLDEYLEMLQHDPAELLRLQEELLIHVTSFFREPASYAALAELVFPRLLARKNDGTPLRFWVPGCSTGEEVYSFGMLLLESLKADDGSAPIQIFGSDVSEAAIEKARAGVYPASIVADVSPERLRRFFTRVDGGGFRIAKNVRDRCVFARQDVTRDPPFSRLDLIVCRNLLIYLNQSTQRKVLGVFHYALRPDGILMLGGSETVGSQTNLFSLFAKKFQLYRKKVNGGRPELEILAAEPVQKSPLAATPRIAAPVPRSRLNWDAQSDANRFLLDRYSPPAVVVDGDLRIVRSRGSTSPFLELPHGEVSVEVLKMVRQELALPLRAALREAGARGRVASQEGVRFRLEDRARIVDLHVAPLGAGEARQFLVLFEERTGIASSGPGAAAPNGKAHKNAKVGKKSVASGRKAGRGRAEPAPDAGDELADTRRQLQSIIDDLGAANEELQSANEEVLSSNEELQSTNEELDTAKEELQSTNEELNTLNDELRGRNDELSVANSDLSNLLGGIQIPIVMVTRDLRIRRITPAAEKVMNLIPSDIGRPIGHLKPNFVCPDMETLISEAVDTVSIREREVAGTDGKTFALQIRPYKTIDNRIDGAVVVLFDISAVEHSVAALEIARGTGEALMSTMRDPILLLDGEFRVQRANRAFTDAFQMGTGEIEGRFVYELGDRQWDIPALRRLLEEVLPERKNFDGFSVEHTFGRLGRKRLLLDARRIESGRQRQGVILLVVRQVSDLAA